MVAIFPSQKYKRNRFKPNLIRCAAQIYKDVGIECKIRTMKQESYSGITNERIHRTDMEYIRMVRSRVGARHLSQSRPEYECDL